MSVSGAGVGDGVGGAGVGWGVGGAGVGCGVGAGAVTRICSLITAVPPSFHAAIHVVDERPPALHTVAAVFVHKGTGEPDISPEMGSIDMLKASGMSLAPCTRWACLHDRQTPNFDPVVSDATANAQKQSARPPA